MFSIIPRPLANVSPTRLKSSNRWRNARLAGADNGGQLASSFDLGQFQKIGAKTFPWLRFEIGFKNLTNSQPIKCYPQNI